MRKLSLLIIVFFCLVSCEKNGLVPDNEIPNWLKERIAQDEAKINSDPMSGLDIGAWVRYKFEGEFYFEYKNALSSAGLHLYSETGDQVIASELWWWKYRNNKCCKKYVWKGPSYIDYDED